MLCTPASAEQSAARTQPGLPSSLQRLGVVPWCSQCGQEKGSVPQPLALHWLHRGLVKGGPTMVHCLNDLLRMSSTDPSA